MPAGYDYQLSSAAVRGLFGSPPGQRRRLITEIERIVADPFQPPDLEEHSPSGRTYLVAVRGDLIITYWVDHGAKLVNILLLELVSD
jgi:hypothetical protein